MRENTTDLCWVKYLKRVQYQKNTTHHSTIGLTLYEALYNHKPSSCLSADNQPEPELPFSYYEPLLNTSSPSSPVFPTLPDPYLDDISQPIPEGTPIFGKNLSLPRQ